MLDDATSNEKSNENRQTRNGVKPVYRINYSRANFVMDFEKSGYVHRGIKCRILLGGSSAVSTSVSYE